MDLCFFLSYKPSKGVCLQVLEGHGDELRDKECWLLAAYDFKATPKNQLHNRAEATLPKFNIALEKWWLEDYFPIGKVTFQGLC